LRTKESILFPSTVIGTGAGLRFVDLNTFDSAVDGLEHLQRNAARPPEKFQDLGSKAKPVNIVTKVTTD
jgi:hypothetical protein